MILQHEVFEAFVDPTKIGNFWFSSSSERWETGKTIRLLYEEYNAEGEITVTEMEKDKKIAFEWDYGSTHLVVITFTQTDEKSTIDIDQQASFSIENEAFDRLKYELQSRFDRMRQ